MIDIVSILDNNLMGIMYIPSFLILKKLRDLTYTTSFEMHKRIYHIVSKGLIVSLMMSTYLSWKQVNPSYFNAFIIWGITMLSIIIIGRPDIDYILLGYLSSVFMSEYYEIPIYLSRAITGEFWESSSLWIILPKLVLIIPLFILLKQLGYKGFLKLLAVHSIWYIPLGIGIYEDLRHIKNIGILPLKLLCIIPLVLFIYLKRPDYIVENRHGNI